MKEPDVPEQGPSEIVAENVAAVEETPPVAEEPAKVEEEEIPRRGGRTPYTPKPRSKRGQRDKQEDKEVLFPSCTDTNSN